MAIPAISAHELARTFTVGKRRQRRELDAVRDLSFHVEAGERVAFIGPNGAGKSTSIKMLTGILYPSSGSARVLGLVPWEQRKELSMRVGTLFGQRSQLWNELSPRTSLGVLGAVFGLSTQQTKRRLGELGELLDAAELFDQPIRTQSLGQRMRCELAACMLHQPELLFLDEPTIGLDLLGKQLFRELLIRVNEDIGTTIFLTSHDVADIERVARRAIIVNHGTVIYDSTVDAMRRQLLAGKLIEVGLEHPIPSSGREPAAISGLAASQRPTGISGPTAISELTMMPGVSVADSRAGALGLTVEVDTTQTPVRVVLDHILTEFSVADLSIVDPPLEAVIGEIYKRPQQ